jgi:non-specific serine/threonine protein kinase
MQGDYERATELFEESLALGREAADKLSIAWSLLVLGFVASDRDDHKRATEFYEEGLALCRESGYVTMLPFYLSNLGYECLLQGNHEQAAALNEEAAALVRNNRPSGRLWGPIKGPLDRLGWATLLQGDNEQATSWYEESLRVAERLGSRLIATESLEGLACAAGTRGAAERAARLFGVSQALREALNYQQPPGEHALREPYLAAARSRLDESAWKAALSEGQAMTFEEAVSYALEAEAGSDTPDSGTSEDASSERLSE